MMDGRISHNQTIYWIALSIMGVALTVTTIEADDIVRPDDHWDGESEAQPKLVTKHRDGVSGVTVMTGMSFGHLVTGMWVRHLSMGVMFHSLRFRPAAKPQTSSPWRQADYSKLHCAAPSLMPLSLVDGHRLGFPDPHPAD